MRRKDESKKSVILDFIDEYYNEYNEIPAVRTIAEGTGIALATVHRYLLSLKESGELEYNGRKSISTKRIDLESRHASAPVLGYVRCGEGFYTAALFDAAKAVNGSVTGVDISKFAVKAAAGKYKGIDFAVASLFHIPCGNESVDVLTDVFAPIVPEEFRRVLKPGGVMILAVPGAKHLWGMKEVLYTAPYENEEHDTAYDGFEYLGRESVQRDITVEGKENIEALFSMTPYYWKTDVAGGERLRALETLHTEIKFDFLVYRKL